MNVVRTTLRRAAAVAPTCAKAPLGTDRTRPRSPKKHAHGRRAFLRYSAAAVGALLAPDPARTAQAAPPPLDDDRLAVLVDLTACVGCRRCERACDAANGNPCPTDAELDDPAVLDEPRRPGAHQFTVVNRREDPTGARPPIHLKVQCMHCEDPACVSACLVGAMRKQPSGPVTWDADRCIGCRYCLVACPYQNLAYEFDEALAPRVAKCTMCAARTAAGGRPACVEACPTEALRFGRRRELLAVAHERIRRHPDRYVDHVYGEHEAGGASWLYLSDRPFDQLGLPALASASPARRTEAIQHGIFAGFAAPLLLGGLLVVLRRLSRGGGAS